MKMESFVPDSRLAAELIKRSVVSKNTRTGRKCVPIDVNLDLSEEDEFIRYNFEDADLGNADLGNDETEVRASKDDEFDNDEYYNDDQFIGVFTTAQHEKKNGKTLAVIASMTVFLFLLAGISIKFSDRASNLSLLEAQSSSTQQLFVKTNETDQTGQAKPKVTADDSLKSLSNVLSSRISLISSNNPKFIVTAAGTKIVTNDIIGEGLKVVDILNDHIVVSSNGVTRELSY